MGRDPTASFVFPAASRNDRGRDIRQRPRPATHQSSGFGFMLRDCPRRNSRGFAPPPGRLEAVPAQRQFRIFVDYAHTDDALLNVIKTCRELNPARLIVVFAEPVLFD